MTKKEVLIFNQGMLVAAAIVKRSFDEPGIAYEIMKTAGITTRKEVRTLKLDRFDNKQLYEIIKQETGE